VVLRALALFAGEGRTDFLPVADRLLGHSDPEVRAAALRARTRVKADEAQLRAADADESPLVRATALVGLVSGGWISDEERGMLDDILKDGSAEARVALARAIGEQPSDVFEDTLLRLAEGREDEVQVQTALAMGEFRSPRFLPSLLPLLGKRDVRQAARAAFLGCGEEGLAFLDQSLADQAYPHEVRRHLPRTISLFPPEAAAAVLQRHLISETDGMVRFKILRGLNRLAAHPEVELDGQILRQATEATLEAAFRLVHWRAVLERGALSDRRRATPGHDLLARLLRDKEAHALERIFRLLALQHRSEDFKGIYRGLRNPSAKVKAGSLELLENLVRPPLRDPLIALIDDAPDLERLARAVPYYQARPFDYEELLGLILEQPGESLRCIAAYHVGELGLTSFRARLESFPPAETGFFLSRVIERTLALLARPGGGALAHA
jgi:HEAT repeat protein